MISLMVRCSCLKLFDSMSDTGEGSTRMERGVILIVESSMTPRTCSTTLAIVSPGRILMLTTALALVGRTFSLTPDSNIVAAWVVRIIALLSGDFSSCDFNNGAKIHRLAIIIFFGQVISGPMNSKNLKVGSANCDGKGACSSL